MKLSYQILLLALVVPFLPSCNGDVGAVVVADGEESKSTITSEEEDVLLLKKKERTTTNLRPSSLPLPLPTNHEDVATSFLAPKAAPAQISEIPRSYSAQHDEYKRQKERRLNVNCINTAVAALLPTINELIQEQIPDPIPIDQTTLQTLTDSSTCSGNTVDCNYLTTEFTGAKSTEITTLQVIEGTETFSCGCPSNFGGDFNFVTSASTYAVTGTGSLSATGCTAYSSGYTGSVVNPVFSGTIYLAGTICVNEASITGYEIKSISATCDSVSTTLSTGVTSEYSNIESSFTQDIGTDYKNYLSTTVLNIMTDAINTALSNVRLIPLGLGGGIPIILEFYRAAAQRRAQSFLGWIADTSSNTALNHLE